MHDGQNVNTTHGKQDNMETFYICVSVVQEITPQQGDRIKDGNLLESDVTLSLYKASFLSTNSKNPVRITSKSA